MGQTRFVRSLVLNQEQGNVSKKELLAQLDECVLCLPEARDEEGNEGAFMIIMA